MAQPARYRIDDETPKTQVTVDPRGARSHNDEGPAPKVLNTLPEFGCGQHYTHGAEDDPE